MTKATNGDRAAFAWKLVAVLLGVLVLIGGYLHGLAVSDVADLENKQIKQSEEIQSLEVRSALMEQATIGIQEKQEALSVTLTEVRDAVIRIEAKIE